MNNDALRHGIEFIDSWLKFRFDREDIPGLTVAISYKGDLLLNKAYGYADTEKKIELTPDYLFRIASHSKTFTATAIMMLVEDNKLRIDDYVVDYLSFIKKHKDKRWNKVTIRQLMSHGAGIIRDGVNEDYWQLIRPFPDEKRFKEEILNTDLVLDNNTKLKYSNYGYSLLGLVIEAVAAQPYNDFVNERIIKKLGLNNTFPEYSKSINYRLTKGYSRIDIRNSRLPIQQIYTNCMSSATGFCSNGEDLCKYFNAQMIGSNKLLNDESKKEMQRMQWRAYDSTQSESSDYGLGMEIESVGGKTLIGHGGGFPGHSTKTTFDPKSGLVVSVLTNCIDGPSLWINRGIWDVVNYFQDNTPKTKPKHDLKMLEGMYMNLWSIMSIVVTGDKVAAAHIDSWDPLSGVQDFEFVNNTTFKVVNADSYGYEGELVRFDIKAGKVETVNYTGSTMWPKDLWLKKIKDKKEISIP